ADLDTGPESGALRRHLLDARVDEALLHLDGGDAVAKQPTDAVLAPVRDAAVTCARELVCRGEAGGPRARGRDGLARQPLRWLRLHPSVGERVVGDRLLDALDRDRRLVDAEHARALAWCGAQPAGELREVVRGVQPVAGCTALISPGQVVPLRDEIAQRAAGVAEGHAAVHAPAGLTAQHGVV